MCNLSDRIEEKALEKGKQIGLEQGIEREKINSVVTLIQNSHLSFEEAIKLLNLPEHLIDTCRRYVFQEMNVE